MTFSEVNSNVGLQDDDPKERPGSKTPPDRKSGVLVAMSGGVDSALTAALLKQQGWEVLGVHFLLPASQRMIEARSQRVRDVAEYLRIPLVILDVREAFRGEVILPFVEAYLKGRTPNPCVRCNAAIKFRYLKALAEEKGASRIATGHYARLVLDERCGKPLVLRGLDRAKEQSYFLHRLNQDDLSRALLPLGEISKVQAREMAAEMGLPLHPGEESQDVCFLEGRDYRAFIESETGSLTDQEGEIVDLQGRVLGTHSGAFRYTVGQRQGLGIASSEPYYVLDIRIESRQVVVARRQEVLSSVVDAEDFNWMDGTPPEQEMDVEAQVRYRHRAAPGRMRILEDGGVRVSFLEPQWAVTPGQALVCYVGDRVLGGGWIRGRVGAS
jgi:tRNA-specific 2-thiouridylase